MKRNELVKNKVNIYKKAHTKGLENISSPSCPPVLIGGGDGDGRDNGRCRGRGCVAVVGHGGRGGCDSCSVKDA